MNSLPTDNLYKFCAIAGLIIIGFSLYYPVTLARTVFADITDIEMEMDILKAESQFLEVRIKRLTEISKNSIAAQKTGHKPNPEKLEIHYSEQEIKNMDDEIERLDRDMHTATAKVHGKTRKLKIFVIEFWIISLLSIASLFTGMKITVYGFRSWHRLVQMPLDKKLKETGS